MPSSSSTWRGGSRAIVRDDDAPDRANRRPSAQPGIERRSPWPGRDQNLTCGDPSPSSASAAPVTRPIDRWRGTASGRSDFGAGTLARAARKRWSRRPALPGSRSRAGMPRAPAPAPAPEPAPRFDGRTLGAKLGRCRARCASRPRRPQPRPWTGAASPTGRSARRNPCLSRRQLAVQRRATRGGGRRNGRRTDAGSRPSFGPKPRRRSRALHQHDRAARLGQVRGCARADDPAADDRNVEAFHRHAHARGLSGTRR